MSKQKTKVTIVKEPREKRLEAARALRRALFAKPYKTPDHHLMILAADVAIGSVLLELDEEKKNTEGDK